MAPDQYRFLLLARFCAAVCFLWQSAQRLRRLERLGRDDRRAHRPIPLPERPCVHLPRRRSGQASQFTWPATSGRRSKPPAPYRAPLPRSAPYRAAILIAQGWNPKQVQARLGHASVKTSLDCYGHLFDGHDAELLEGLDSVVRAGACPIRVQRVSKSFLREQKRPHKGPLTCMFV